MGKKQKPKPKPKLVAAPLERLSRKPGFLLTLLDSEVEVVFGDMPQIPGAMGKFVVGVMAQVADLRAGFICERTNTDLARKPVQTNTPMLSNGWEWGGPRSRPR